MTIINGCHFHNRTGYRRAGKQPAQPEQPTVLLKKLLSEFTFSIVTDSQKIIRAAVIIFCQPDQKVHRNFPDPFLITGIDVSVAFENGRDLLDRQITVDTHVF